MMMIHFSNCKIEILQKEKISLNPLMNQTMKRKKRIKIKSTSNMYKVHQWLLFWLRLLRINLQLSSIANRIYLPKFHYLIITENNLILLAILQSVSIKKGSQLTVNQIGILINTNNHSKPQWIIKKQIKVLLTNQNSR